MTKRRNLRQRKKLHVGEFKEFGFTIELELREGLTEADEDLLIDSFIAEVIESRGLMYGGSLGYGFVCSETRGNVGEEDRVAVREWLTSRPEVVTVSVSELVDAWQ